MTLRQWNDFDPNLDESQNKGSYLLNGSLDNKGKYYN